MQPTPVQSLRAQARHSCLFVPGTPGQVFLCLLAHRIPLFVSQLPDLITVLDRSLTELPPTQLPEVGVVPSSASWRGPLFKECRNTDCLCVRCAFS